MSSFNTYCQTCNKPTPTIPRGFRECFEDQIYKCSICHTDLTPSKSRFNALLLTGFILLFLAIFINSVSAISISPSNSNPTSGQVINAKNVLLDFNITTVNPLSQLIWNWNGTNYSLYDDSLVLAYNFDNRSSLGENDTYVVDISRYGNNGTVFGCTVGSCNITWTPNGKYNGGFNFNGNYSFINTTLNYTHLNKDNFTLSAWINLKNDGITRVLFGGSNFIFRITNDNYIVFYPKASAYGQWFVSGLRASMDNNWYYINLIFDQNNNQAYVYLNNNYLGNRTITDDVNPEKMIIGKWSTSYFNGTIDEVRVWNRSLSSQEIQQNYYSQLTKYNNSQYIYNNNESSLTYDNYNYNLFTNDSSSNSVQVQDNLFIKLSSTISLSNLLGTFNGDYGTNTHGAYLTNDTSGMYTYTDDTSMYWYQNMFLQSKMETIRADMDLQVLFPDNENINKGTTFNKYKNLVSLAKTNGYKIMWIADYMPTWLANTTINGMNCTSRNYTCPPTNLTTYANLVVSFLQNMSCTPESCEVELWNEPYSTFFIYDMGTTSSGLLNRTIWHNLMYNATYNSVKSYNSSYQFGLNIYPNQGYGNFMRMTMGNLSYDFIDTHEYLSDTSSGNMRTSISNNIDAVFGNCSAYGYSCNKVYIGEFNTANSTFNLDFNNFNKQNFFISELYNYALNKYQKNISFISYHLAGDSYQMLNYTSRTAYGLFNVTYMFTRYANGDIYNSSATNWSIYSVASKNGATWSILITNAENDLVNISAILPSGTYISVNDGTLYTSDGINPVNLGIIDAYGVEYYTNPSALLVGGTWYLTNYLGELLRPASQDELNLLGFGSGISASKDNSMFECQNTTTSISNLISLISVIFLILGVAIIISVLTFLIQIIKGQEVTKIFGINLLGIIFIEFFILGVTLFATILGLGVICSL